MGDIQLRTRAAGAAHAIPDFTSELGEGHLGARDPNDYDQKGPAAQVQTKN